MRIAKKKLVLARSVTGGWVDKYDIRYSPASTAMLSRLVRPIRERIWWYVRVEAVDWPVFEHCEAAPTPPGGVTYV